MVVAKTPIWNLPNWQSQCEPCHDRKTAAEDGGWRRRLPQSAICTLC